MASFFAKLALLGWAASAILVQENATKEPYRVQLKNTQDVQYFGTAKVGGQDLTVLLDSGSFEVVLWGQDCKTCGPAKPYKRKDSGTYQKGSHKETITFGSGTVWSNEAYEMVSLGPYSQKRQPFWEVHKADMPVLDQAIFQGVIGTGPPGEPVDTAKQQLREAEENLRKNTNFFKKRELQQKVDQAKDKVANEQTKLTLFEAMGVPRYSTCYGRESGSAGWFVVNDYDPRKKPEFIKLPKQGALEWSVKINKLALGYGDKEVDIGCSNGCGGLMDTGTSLFGLTTDYMHKAHRLLKKGRGDCGNIKNYPDLVITIGKNKLRFPPTSYIGKLHGLATPSLKKMLPSDVDLPAGIDQSTNSKLIRLYKQKNSSTLHMQKQSSGSLASSKAGFDAESERKSCQVLVMDLGDSSSEMGPLVILGMPFFREYYTTFDLDPTDRAMFAAPAGDSCQPAGKGLKMRKTEQRMMNIDQGHLQGPNLRFREDGKVQL